jgi:hypothetical protein
MRAARETHANGTRMERDRARILDARSVPASARFQHELQPNRAAIAVLSTAPLRGARVRFAPACNAFDVCDKDVLVDDVEKHRSLADIRKWRRILEAITKRVEHHQDPHSELAELRAELDAAEARRASAGKIPATARVRARQLVLSQLARKADQFLATHVALSEDRRAARNQLLELLFDASDVGANESIRGG